MLRGVLCESAHLGVKSSRAHSRPSRGHGVPGPDPTCRPPRSAVLLTDEMASRCQTNWTTREHAVNSAIRSRFSTAGASPRHVTGQRVRVTACPLILLLRSHSVKFHAAGSSEHVCKCVKHFIFSSESRDTVPNLRAQSDTNPMKIVILFYARLFLKSHTLSCLT